jgi:hypothetical protein
MDTNTTEITIRAYLGEIRARIDQAAGIAKAAQACADAGQIDRGVERSTWSNWSMR